MELTGRENIFLNGTLGMIARVGFAIATDKRPDILIVDEVLAVGDENFQQKSTAQMREFREHGTTTLLVSHNMKTVQTVCKRAMWLEGGVVKAAGASGEVVSAYLAK